MSAVTITTHPIRGFVRRSVINPLIRGAVALPLAIAAVPLAFVGGAGRAAARQTRVARRFGAQIPESTGRKAGFLGVLKYSALTVLPGFVALVLAGLFVYGIGAGYLYPLRPDAIGGIGHMFTPSHQFSTSWGGPTLAGAWAAHALIVVGAQLGILLLLRPVNGLLDRLARRHLVP